MNRGSASPAVPGLSRQAGPKSSFRGDIQGLRAVAVLLVMLWHAGVPVVPGGFIGVDVFFVVSGYLMTGLLLTDLREHGRISLLGFYARRARRLLPAAVVVLLVVMLTARLVLPATRWEQLAGDLLASLGFSMNWRLTLQAVNYLFAYSPPSALQHFWSLGVEEQFYFLWPLWMAVLWWAGRRLRLRPMVVLAAGMVVALLLSLAVSVVATELYPSRAYFATPTRVWELAVGAVLAVVAHRLTAVGRRTAAVAAWVGLGVVLATGVVFTRATPFPGSWALVPVLATAVIIGLGPAAGSAGPVRVLGTVPLRRIGDWSYSLYLWHWPLIVFASSRVGGPDALRGELGLPLGLLVVAASFVPAYLTYRYVEEPFRSRRHSRSSEERRRQERGVLAVSGLSLLAVAAAMVVFAATLPEPRSTVDLDPPLATRLGTAAAPRVPAVPLGAEVLSRGGGGPADEDVDVDSVIPDPRVAAADVPTCQMGSTESTDVRTCVSGNSSSTTEVVVVGDSHVQQWLPALDAVAVRRNWKLTAYLHPSCAFVEAELFQGTQPDRPCNTWNRNVRERLAASAPPAALVTSNFAGTMSVSRSGSGLRANARAHRQAWTALAKRSPVVVLRDTPTPGFDVPECVLLHPDSLGRCAAPAAALADAGAAQVLAAAGLPDVHLVDLNDLICPGGQCAAVVGGVLVYRDHNHLSATYSATLAAALDLRLQGPVPSPRT